MGQARRRNIKWQVDGPKAVLWVRRTIVPARARQGSGERAGVAPSIGYGLVGRRRPRTRLEGGDPRIPPTRRAADRPLRRLDDDASGSRDGFV